MQALANPNPNPNQALAKGIEKVEDAVMPTVDEYDEVTPTLTPTLTLTLTPTPTPTLTFTRLLPEPGSPFGMQPAGVQVTKYY